jgi:ArpU family phage transcriptional regulator
MPKLYTDSEIETILRKYKTWEAQANILEKLPSMTAAYTGMPHGSGVSNQTQNLAVARAGVPKVARDLVEVIDKAYNALDDECKEMVKLYYFEGRYNNGVMEEMKIGTKQLRNLKSKAKDKIKEVFEVIPFDLMEYYRMGSKGA